MIYCPLHGWQKANKHMEERIFICEKCDSLLLEDSNKGNNNL